MKKIKQWHRTKELLAKKLYGNYSFPNRTQMSKVFSSESPYKAVRNIVFTRLYCNYELHFRFNRKKDFITIPLLHIGGVKKYLCFKDRILTYRDNVRIFIEFIKFMAKNAPQQ